MKIKIRKESKKISPFTQTRKLLFFCLFFLFLTSPVLSQAVDTGTLSLTATVERRCKIEINSSWLSFSRTSWSDQPQQIPANEGAFELVIKLTSNYNSTVNVWLMASSDFQDSSTGYTIPIETISWKAQGAGFYSGQLNKTSPVLVARLSGSGVFKGSLYFNFADDPKNFAPGTYQTTVTILVEGV